MLSKNIKRLRKEFNFTQKDLADLLNISQQTVASWETGRTEPSYEFIDRLSNIFQCDSAVLFGKEKKTSDVSEVDNIFTVASYKKIPILGTIACGDPILAEENIEGYTNVELNIHADFALRCKGDSMAPKFLDGDIVLIRQQPVVENGQIAAVLIGNEATLKHVYTSNRDILLVADNPQYEPLIFDGEEMNNIRILGLAIGYTRIF